MFILGTLCPRCHQIGQLEESGGHVARSQPIPVVFVDPTSFAASEIFSDVVEIDVDRRRGPPTGPVLRGCLEVNLDLGWIDGLALDQCAQRVVDLGYHLLIIQFSLLRRYGQRSRREGNG